MRMRKVLTRKCSPPSSAGPKEHDAVVVSLCAKMESEILELPAEERASYYDAAGISSPGSRAWPRPAVNCSDSFAFLPPVKKKPARGSFPKGTKAPQAAGKIHSDIERGFIRARRSASTMISSNSVRAGRFRTGGLLAIEGKEYVMQEGDVAHFRFSV